MEWSELPPTVACRHGVYDSCSDGRGEHCDVGHEGHNGPGAVMAVGTQTRCRFRRRVDCAGVA
eukprot:2639473-Pleurochrysis_carterae.AAC.1